MEGLKILELDEFKKYYNLDIFVETGTGEGIELEFASRYKFDTYYSCEILPNFYAKVSKKFDNYKDVYLHNKNSIDFLKDILIQIPQDKNILFWLDSSLPSMYLETYDNKYCFPLEEELDVIKKIRKNSKDVIFINNLRIYESGPYKNENWDLKNNRSQERMPHLLSVYYKFSKTHEIQRNYEDNGYLLLTPRENNSYIPDVPDNQMPYLSEVYEDILGVKTDGYFVEFGVGEVLFGGSTTTFLADMGWKGIYVDANPECIRQAKLRHKFNDCQCFTYAVGNEHKDLILRGDSVSEMHTDAYQKLGWYGNQELYDTPTKEIPANELLKMVQCPNKFDVLSIDVEGFEEKIVSSMDFNKYRPKIALIETRHNDPVFIKYFPEIVKESLHVVNIFKQNGYEIYHSDSLNTIFVDKRK